MRILHGEIWSKKSKRTQVRPKTHIYTRASYNCWPSWWTTLTRTGEVSALRGALGPHAAHFQLPHSFASGHFHENGPRGRFVLLVCSGALAEQVRRGRTRMVVNGPSVYTRTLTANCAGNTSGLDRKRDALKGLAKLASWDEKSCFQDSRKTIN